MNHTNERNWYFAHDQIVFDQFKKVALENGDPAEEILLGFMKDYTVSKGHPERVRNRWPWNKQT